MKHKFLFSVFVIFFVLVFVSLGTWQIIRLNWKNNLIFEIENSLKNPPVELSNINHENYFRVKTSGDIDFEKQIYLYNLNENGTPGFEVINPLSVNQKNYLINRGWISFEKKGMQEINEFDEKNIVGTLKLQGRKNIFKPDNDIKENYILDGDGKESISVLVPPRVLNAHQCLSGQCIFHYKWSHEYTSPQDQWSVCYNDSQINPQWNCDFASIISDRDMNADSLLNLQKRLGIK